MKEGVFKSIPTYRHVGDDNFFENVQFNQAIVERKNKLVLQVLAKVPTQYLNLI